MTLARRLLTVAQGGGSITSPVFDPVVTVASTSTLASGGALDWHGRATIKRRSDDVLVMIYRAGTIHWSNDAELRIRFSDDDGATWTAVNTKLGGGAVTGFPMNPGTGNIGIGDGWLMVAPNGDLVLHMWSMTGSYPGSFGFAGTWQSRSTDGGETWDTPAQVTFIGNPDDDDQTFATDDDFVFDGVMYAGARIYYQNDGELTESGLIRSDDDGATWEYVSTIMAQNEGGTGGQEFGMEYIGNDTIIAMIRDNGHTDSYQRMSTDMGETWGTLTNVTSTVGIAARQRVYTRNHLKGEADWWTDPVLLMVGFEHQSSGTSTSRRNAIWLSPNQGTTWDGPHYLDTTTQDAGYGDMFYDATNDRWVVVNYQGTNNAASLKQYNLSISGI